MIAAIRTMKVSDVPSAMELSTAANWNQTDEDWLRILALFPGGCRCIEDAGKIVAIAALLSYDQRLAWIGMVLTRPEYRRQGHAKKLMEDAIALAERSGILCLKLDATDEGRPIYERLGFIVESAVERWGRDKEEVPTSGPEHPTSKHHTWQTVIPDAFWAHDAAAFGADRRFLLEGLSVAGKCTASANGYALSRPGRVARQLGPCVATSEEEAMQLIGARLSSDDDIAATRHHWYWDLLPDNVAAVRIAERLGFTRRRLLWRMRRGNILRKCDAMADVNVNATVFAIAGFELG